MQIIVKLSREENLNYYQQEEINIDLEEYLVAVVASEIGNAPIEACKAQAVAARNFTLKRIQSRGWISDKSSTDQAFRASRLTGYPNAEQGVKSTRNEVLYYNGRLCECYYYNSNTGYTRSSLERWGTKIPYLISQQDPYDTGTGTAHGVGLCQVGAANRAKAGHTYKQILSFYFPNTELGVIEMTKEEKILDWIKAHINADVHYLWGAATEKMSASNLRDLAEQYPDYVNYEKDKNCIGKKVYDCQGFVRVAMEQANIYLKSGATTQYKTTEASLKGVIDQLPLDKVALVYRKDEKENIMQHTGIYLGDGTVADCRSKSQGVVHQDISKYNWTHFLIPKGIYSEPIQPREVIVMYNAKVVADTGSTVNMRASASTSSVRRATVPIGAIVEVLEETNSEWSKICYNNTTGYMMKKFLSKQEGGSYVKINCESVEQAKQLLELLHNATLGN